MTDAEYRNEVKRARKILKRLASSADPSKATAAISEIVTNAQLRFTEVNDRVNV